MAQTAGSTSSTEPGDEGVGSTASMEERRPASAPEGVSLGLVVGAHGLRGELRVRATHDDQSNLESVPSVRLVREEGDERPREYPVESVRPGRSGECRLRLRGVTDRDAALALRGARVLARSDQLQSLAPGEFYAYELVGCEVFEADGRAVGTVRSVLETGGHDVLEIEALEGGVALVPAKEPLLAEVDVAGRRIVVDAPPGLLERERERE